MICFTYLFCVWGNTCYRLSGVVTAQLRARRPSRRTSTHARPAVVEQEASSARRPRGVDLAPLRQGGSVVAAAARLPVSVCAEDAGVGRQVGVVDAGARRWKVSVVGSRCR